MPNYGSVNFDITGGGGNGVYYNSCWINRVQQPPSYQILRTRNAEKDSGQKMKTKNGFLFSVILAITAAFVLAAPACAQSDSGATRPSSGSRNEDA